MHEYVQKKISCFCFSSFSLGSSRCKWYFACPASVLFVTFARLLPWRVLCVVFSSFFFFHVSQCAFNFGVSVLSNSSTLYNIFFPPLRVRRRKWSDSSLLLFSLSLFLSPLEGNNKVESRKIMGKTKKQGECPGESRRPECGRWRGKECG